MRLESPPGVLPLLFVPVHVRPRLIDERRTHEGVADRRQYLIAPYQHFGASAKPGRNGLGILANTTDTNEQRYKGLPVLHLYGQPG